MTTLIPESTQEQLQHSSEAIMAAKDCNITKEIIETILKNGCDKMEYYEFLNIVEPITIKPSDKAKIIVLSPAMNAHLNPVPDETLVLKEEKIWAVGLIIFLIVVVIGLLVYIYKMKEKKH